MRELKKKTLALILASNLAIAGSFAAEKYSNTLMGIDFKAGDNGEINMVLETKVAYSGNITPIKREAGTYILMLPNINSSAPTPNLENAPGNIESVNIRTMPYTTKSNGYTRITIKTITPAKFVGKNKIYIPTEKKEPIAIEDNEPSTRIYQQNSKNEYIDEFSSLHSHLKKQNNPITIDSNSSTHAEAEIIDENIDITNEFIATEKYTKTNTSYETFLLILGALLIIACSTFFYVKAKNKLTEIAGEKLEIELEEEEEPKKENEKEKIKKIKETVKTLDKMYSKTAVRSVYNSQQIKPTIEVKPIDNSNIVDLDKLFEEEQNKKQTNEEEENLALEEFLSGFSFQEEPLIEEEAFDEKTYKEILNSSICFSPEDIKCINELLFTEINNETIKNIEKYSVSNPIKATKTKKEILETLLTDYAINQDICFEEKDVNIIKDLINVELDSDFINNLKTDPQRTKEMQKEIEKFDEELKKPSKALTLKVKDMLPDLSEELRKHGTKRIESNYKPEAIYFQKGYDVSILSVNDVLSNTTNDLTLNNSEHSSYDLTQDLVDTSYDVPKLNVANLLYSEKKVTEEKPKPKIDVKNEIMQKIADKNTEKTLKEIPVNKIANTTQENAIPNKTNIKKCIEGNESYTIINSVELSENIGCHLARNEKGYVILKYKGDSVSKMKELDSIKNERIQARLSKKIDDETQRFIIKIDTKKFIVDIKNNEVNYVMDLC